MKKMISIFLIVFLLLINPVTGVILCMGEDGHLAIEPTTDADQCCNEIHSHPASNNQQQLFDSNQADDCGVCWDIPISFHNESAITLVQGINLAKYFATFIVIVPQTIQDPVPPVYKNHSIELPPSTQSLPLLNTIRLII